MSMRPVTTTIQTTTVRMPTQRLVTRTPHTRAPTTQPVMVTTAVQPAPMPTPPLMLIMRRKLPAMLRELATMPAMPKSVHTKLLDTMVIDTTVGTNWPTIVK